VRTKRAVDGGSSAERQVAWLDRENVAYHLDQVRFLRGLIRTLCFIPFLTTAAAMAWVWRWFYQPVPIGIFNLILVDLGFARQPFLRSTSQALGAVLAQAIWAGLGFQVVVFLAGLRAMRAR
jgi:multiple sugar transport system permease protein